LSSDKENAYFADGIQDEILTRLSKIADLKVISRTSTQHYKSAPENLPEIARQLGVAHIVEGSVQKNGDAVRVNVQLITAATDSHLWADTFDRKLIDIFSVESEVSKAIADQLLAKLTGQEEQVIAAKPTDNPAAYDAYLRGRAFAAGPGFDKSSVDGAIQSYQEAVKLDPGFALAWARLSCVESSSYWGGIDRSPARLAAAKDAADRAHGLNPDLAETHLALGYYSYYGPRDFAGALAEFQVAEKGLPNNADVLVAMGHIKRRLARWEEAIAAQRRVIELDPRDSSAYITLTTTYGAVRRFPEAMATIDRVLAWEPANLLALFYKAQIFWANGDVPAAERLLANSGAAPELLGRQALFQRSYTTAITLFSRAVATEKQRGESSEDEQLLLGLSQQRAGDVAAARTTYEEVVRMLQHELANVLPDSGPGASLHAALGLAYAGLGDAVSAVSEGQKAMTMDPTSKNPFEGPAQEENLARIHAILGDADHAIPILERLLRIPYGGAMTPALLRIDPMFDPIRPDPRFQKLISDGEAAMKAQTKP
jgi:TolB-like protein/Flp pilus assembly protein TadD